MAISKEETRVLLNHVSVVGNKSSARTMSEPLQVEILGGKTQVTPQPGDAFLCIKEGIDGVDHNYALLTYITNLNDRHILSPQGVEYIKQVGCGVLPPFEFAALLHADGYSTIGMWLDIACGLSVRTDAADLARRAYLKATSAKDSHNPLT